jgi:hydroxymethylbilane synthase
MEEVAMLFPGLTWSEHLVSTAGDLSDAPLSTLTTPGIFISALRDELLRNNVDVIVHSMKDLPALPHPGISLAAIPTREDPRDTLICSVADSLEALPLGARVGTSSPRREASLRRLRPDLQVAPIRGNITTRLEKVARGDYDATILAKAGLIRAGLTDAIAQELDLTEFLPAPRQGALAVECRREDLDTFAFLSALDDHDSRASATAEQAVLIGLAAGCHVAIGAHARWANDELMLHAELGLARTGEAVNVRRSVGVNSTLEDAHALGLSVAEALQEFPLSAEALDQ